MKKLYSLLVLIALTTTAAMAQLTAHFYADDQLVLNPGGRTTMHFSMQHEMELCGFQVFVRTPEGLKVAYDEEEEEYLVALNPERVAKTHLITAEDTSNGRVMIIGEGTKVRAYNGNDGVICTIEIEAAEDAVPGEYKITLDEMGGSTLDAVFVEPDEDPIYVPVIIQNVTGLSNVDTKVVPTQILDLNGRAVKSQTAGLQIIRMSDGSVRKVMNY